MALMWGKVLRFLCLTGAIVVVYLVFLSLKPTTTLLITRVTKASTTHPARSTPIASTEPPAFKRVTKASTTHATSFTPMTTTEPPIFKVEVFPAWTTYQPLDLHPTHRLYLYSAFIAIHRLPPAGTDIHLVAFRETGSSLSCCLKRPGHRPYRAGTVHVDHASSRPGSKLEPVGVVLLCHVPFTPQELNSSGVTLTPPNQSCPGRDRDYVAVENPERKSRGITICGKMAYGQQLHPGKLIEWFEVQRLLGVERIVIFDLGNTVLVRKVFRHYQDTGLLTLIPYQLPGRKWGRDLVGSRFFKDDETLPIWDCRLRLAGYKYVMGIDMDEVILPRSYNSLSQFFDTQFQKHGANVSSLFFNVQFFVDDWGPVERGAPIMMLQYLNSTQARWECYKYVYIPSKVHQAQTHVVFSYQGFSRRRVPSAEAVIFHYRRCPQVWKSCNPPRITDRSMLRFRDKLVPPVLAVRDKVGL